MSDTPAPYTPPQPAGHTAPAYKTTDEANAALKKWLDEMTAHARAMMLRGDAAEEALARMLTENAQMLAAAVLYPAGPWTEGQEASRQHLQLEYFAMKKRALAAEARVQELLGEMAGLATQVQEVKITALRLKVEISEQEVAKLDLILHNVRLRGSLERAADALAGCYNVTDYPASGESPQDVALLEARMTLAAYANG